MGRPCTSLPREMAGYGSPRDGQRRRPDDGEDGRDGDVAPDVRDPLERTPLLHDMDVAAKTGSLSGWTPSVHFEWFAGVAPVGSPRLALSALVVNDNRWKIKGSYVEKEGAQLLLRVPLVDAARLLEGARDPEVDPAGPRGQEGEADGQGEVEKGEEGGEVPEARLREDRGEGLREAPGRERFHRKGRRVAPRDRWNSSASSARGAACAHFPNVPSNRKRSSGCSRRRAGPLRAQTASRGGSSWWERTLRPGAAVEEALDAGNAWAKHAPVLIVAGARREDAAVVESREYFLLDTGLALMSLLYRAVDQGLLVDPMAGWKEGPLRAALGLPEDFTPAAVVAVGYAGKSVDLDEATRKKDEKPRARKPLGEVAFRSRWGEPFEATLPSLPAKVYETELQLRFGDTDAMGHVNNAKVVTYLELGRMKFFADVLGAERVEDIRFILAEDLLPLPDPHPASRSRLRADAHHRRQPELLPSSAEPVRSQGRPRFRRGGDGPGDVRLHDGAPCPMDADFLARVRDYIGG